MPTPQTTHKTPAEKLAELKANFAEARNSVLLPGRVRDTVESLGDLAELLVAANDEQAAQIEALQASSLAAHAELEARVKALEGK